MLSVNPTQCFGGRNARGMAGGLGGAEIAAIAKDGENVSLLEVAGQIRTVR